MVLWLGFRPFTSAARVQFPVWEPMWYRLYCALLVVRETLMVLLVLIELSATNARSEPAGLAYILTNFRPSSGMVGMLMICKNARQAPRAASQEARMCDVIARPTVAS